MAKFQDGIDSSALAKADLNSYQYHFVQSEGPASGSVGYVNVATGASLPGPIGVLQNDPNAGQEAQIRHLGSTQLVVNAAGSAIGYGRYLTCGSDGHGEPVDDSSASLAFAWAMGYTTSDGATLECWVQPFMYITTGS